MISGIGAYILTYSLVDDPLAAFLASLVYALNPWILDRFMQLTLYFSYAWAPLHFWMFIKAFETDNITYIYGIAILSLFIIPSIHIIAMLIIFELSVFVYFLIQNRYESKISIYKVLKIFALMVILSFAILSFIIFPLIYLLYLCPEITLRNPVRMTSGITALIYGKFQTIWNTFRFMGLPEEWSFLPSSYPRSDLFYKIWVFATLFYPFLSNIYLFFFINIIHSNLV
jgi:hypothetical protein